MASKGSSTLKELLSEMDQVLEVIEKSGLSECRQDFIADFNDNPRAQSILERCEELVDFRAEQIQPPVRIIQHFACSGGTLVSKCIAALPNVFLLSELHPHTQLHMGGNKAKFLPSDITTQARYARVPNIDELALKLFNQNIKSTVEHVNLYGGDVVIREHTHSDYCQGNQIAQSGLVESALKDDFNIIKLATIRNPIDAYLSLKQNGWVHFLPATFDEYCRRFLAFVNKVPNDCIIKYEDFVNEPVSTMALMAEKLKLTYDTSFIDTFSVFQVTGDSGRKGDTISVRERKSLDEEYIKEILSSGNFKDISKRFGYEYIGDECD